MHHPSQEDPVVGSSNTHSKAEPLRAGGGDGPPHRGNLLMGERLLLACQRKDGPSGDLLQPPGRSERKPQTREARTALGSDAALGELVLLFLPRQGRQGSTGLQIPHTCRRLSKGEHSTDAWVSGRRKRNAGTVREDCAKHKQHSADPHGLYSERERNRDSTS